MAAPGVTVTVRDAAPPRSAPTDTDTWFVAGFAEQGPIAPKLVESLDEYVATFGARVTYGYLYDALDVFFREGGSKAYVSRVVGPAKAAATISIDDADSDPSLVVTAKTVGDWANGIQIVAAGTGPYTLTVKDSDGNTLETSPSLTTQQDAADWSAGSAYVTITVGAGAAIPAAGTSTLAGGDDDHDSATDANWKSAIDLFTADLGPGQISMPGRTTSQAHSDQLAHAQAKNRVALIDYTDGTASAVATAADTDRDADGARYGGGFAPWATVPGVTAGTTRTVPYSAVAAGIMARNDRAGLSPNVPAAGVINGVSTYAIGLSQSFTDSDRATLNDAGVNAAIVKNGAVTTYGYRTLADPDTDLEHVPLSNARLEMAIVADGSAIGDRYVFAQLDGKGLTLADFGGDLAAMLQTYYDAGSLFGATAQEAYEVNVGSPINTADTAAAFELNAQLLVRYSKFGEKVGIYITRTAITEAI